MKKSICILIVGLVVGCVNMLPNIASADGKFYTREEIPPDLPYQQAVISYQDGQELLILQSKFEGKGKDFGWVVPLPVNPKIGSLTADVAMILFDNLNRRTQPTIISGKGSILMLVLLISFVIFFILLISYIIKKKLMNEIHELVRGFLVSFLLFGLILFVGSVINILLAVSSDVFIEPFLLSLISLIGFLLSFFAYVIKKKPVPKFLRLKIVLLLLLILISFIGVGILTPGTAGRSFVGVEILSEEEIGVYDTKVIKATDSKELIAWLNQHGYKFTPQDETVFKSYIEKGWCFVTARINAKELQKGEFRSVEGLVNPLAFLFESKEIVYPLALTSTIGKETKILLYVFAGQKVSTDIPFRTVFADKQGYPALPDYYFASHKKVDPSDFFDGINLKPGYVTKFRDILTPEEMKHDLIFSPAPDDKPYREIVVRW